MDPKNYYRQIPNVNTLLQDDTIRRLTEQYGKESVKKQIQQVLSDLRVLILENQIEAFEAALPQIIETTSDHLKASFEPSLKKVINATGTVLHTNLGRAPISRNHLDHIVKIASGYSNLEYDLQERKRGERYSHFEQLLCELTGAEAALAVNNNAAAVLLTLSALAKDGEMIVSRGELIEIGGKFRIPDVCEQSGSRLREVGTTNKTHPDDYIKALCEATKVIFKAHTSNYRILGFTESVDAEVLVDIAREYTHSRIPVIEDMGSGALIDCSQFGLMKEPTVQAEIKKGVDLVTFSGDKLLGGPQAGIIVGKKCYIDQIKQHPLTRALRIDKFTVAVLELVIREYQSKERAIQNIPILSMLSASHTELEAKALGIVSSLKEYNLSCQIRIIPVQSSVGGGSMPLEKLDGMGIAIHPNSMTVPELEKKMHGLSTPILPRILDDTIILDVRTIMTDDIPYLIQGLNQILGTHEGSS